MNWFWNTIEKVVLLFRGNTVRRIVKREGRNPNTIEYYHPTEICNHRLNGPAVIYPDGTFLYCIEGCIVRRGGKPSIIHPNGEMEYAVSFGGEELL